ncbi:MAG: hypothetical protein K0R46_2915 [Herbinix sp.]|nr:hypothetical protein [Herbinix sp.]
MERDNQLNQFGDDNTREMGISEATIKQETEKQETEKQEIEKQEIEKQEIEKQKVEEQKQESETLVLTAAEENQDNSTAPIISKEEDSTEEKLVSKNKYPEKLVKIRNHFIKAGVIITGSEIEHKDSAFRRSIVPLLYFIGMVMYLEVVFHFLIYRSVDLKIIYPIIFAIPLGAILAFLAGLFTAKLNKLILWCLSAVMCMVFLIQLVYFNVFKVFFSFQILGMAGDAISEFGSDIVTAIRGNIGGLIILLMPLVILGFIMNNRIDYRRRKMKEQGILLGAGVLLHALALVSLLIFGKLDYSPYDLYYNTKVQDLCGKQLGIITMTRLDISKLLSPQDELVLAHTILTTEPTAVPSRISSPVPTPMTTPMTTPIPEADATPVPTLLPTPTPVDTSPNIMNIDFQGLAGLEKNKTIKTLHNYFASVTPTNKNEYTGMFQGYNLIMITAEGFSPYAVHETKTPTLYRLTREGFVFNNFYTALWQTSTSDGEYVAMTGLIPQGTRSMYHGRSNLWPFSLGHQFNLLGVESKAYHNHSYTYYQRNETHPNLGYLWKAKGNGLSLPTDSWPESDLEMIDATTAEFVEEDQFHVYYLTVSGHMNYTFTGNSMASKNKKLVQDLSYSEDAKAYIACQIELDRALEQLIADLEEAGVADRTVIALSADHYPYGWEKYKLDELAGHSLDPNFEIYKNHFILWCPGMEENIIIDEPCSSLDILPTLSNLFGLEYDSRLLMGQDILSDADPLVVLSNRSFITDQVMYNSTTGETTLLTAEPLPKNYISNLNNIIKNKFTVSKSILEEDYYRTLFGNN